MDLMLRCWLISYNNFWFFRSFDLKQMSIENKSIPGASQQWFGLLALLAQVAQALQEHYFINLCLTENNTSLGNSELSCQYSLYLLQDNQALIIHDYYSFFGGY